MVEKYVDAVREIDAALGFEEDDISRMLFDKIRKTTTEAKDKELSEVSQIKDFPLFVTSQSGYVIQTIQSDDQIKRILCWGRLVDNKYIDLCDEHKQMCQLFEFVVINDGIRKYLSGINDILNAMR